MMKIFLTHVFVDLVGVLLASDVDVQQASLCVVINQPVGNPKRKV
jgi:hypothetical protein